MRLCWPSISVGNQVSVCSLCRMKHLRGCWGGYIPCERVYLLIHVTHFGVATIHRTFGVCLLIIWPHGFSVLFYMSDCSHWKQIVYTLEIQGIHQPISEKSIGYKPCMMSARTYASTVMQGAGLSVSKWLDHRGMKMMRYHTRYFCTAWLIVYVNSTLPDVCENVCVHGQARGMKWGTIFWKLLRKSSSHHSISLEFPRVLSKVGRRNRPPI